jgi:chemotaxis protein CheD
MTASMAELIVRMGELAVSSEDDDVLVTIGLGSCIGLALVDRVSGVAGLAHVVLPDSTEAGQADSAAKFADTAVPALVNELGTAGASRSHLEAVLAGGAQMFGFGRKDHSRLDIGVRNDAAVTAALERERIPLRAKATGGNKGRTIRVHVSTGSITVREAGGDEERLLGTEALR